MELTKMKIEYRKLTDDNSSSWVQLTNIDELIWSGEYELRVVNDDGSTGLPFRFKNKANVTLNVKDHSCEDMLDDERTVIQTITYVEHEGGTPLKYTRTRYNVDGRHTWSYWALATEGGANINMPTATTASLGGVIIGDGLDIDADGKMSLAEKSIDEERLSENLNSRINKAEVNASLAEKLIINNGVELRLGALIENSDLYGGTAYRAYTNKLLANGEVIVANKGYRITKLKIFEGEQEISFVADVDANEYPLDGEGFYYQFEFVKENNAAFNSYELPQVVKSFIRKPFTWSASSSVDDFTSQGTYTIKGNRTSIADGLPINNMGKIEARLTVLEADDCITQVLTLLNVGGGDSNVYVRTRQDNAWGVWGKLQTNVEVGAIGLGQSRTFDDLIDNGIYSGANVYATGTGENGYPVTAYEAFVLVVVNAYLTGGGISQLKYSLLPDGTTTVVTRTKLNGKWSDWGDVADVKPGAVTADKLSADVREKVENPLRALYIATGAEYNDSGVDKTKTAPWGETVTHKAGHYYLNGLGDITEEQMAYTYANSYVIYNINLPRVKENDKKLRTLIPIFNSHGVASLGKTSYSTFAGCANLEVLMWSFIGFTSLSDIVVERLDVAGSHMFNGCSKLRYIHPMKCTASGNIINMFGGCTSLIEAKIHELKGNLSFSNSPNINKNSILCIIQNAAPTTAITVTLHPEAYARLADDVDIVAALEAQPLVSLVCA